MVQAYKEHIQFIWIMIIMYVIGVWGGPIIYPVFPLVLMLFGMKGFFFELLILTLWILMLSDYVPVKNATYDDLQFAKDLKFLAPLALMIFYFLNRDLFRPVPKLFFSFIPFIIIVSAALYFSIDLNVGIQKDISFIMMYFCIPVYTVYLHRKYQERFWVALLTFIIGMLSIGIVLRFAAPQIALIEGTTRFKSVLGNPNGLGIFLNLTFILWITIREMKLASFSKSENWYILLIILISIIWSGSRNGMMSMFLFFLLSRLVKINWFLAIIAVAVVVGFQDQFFDLFLGVVNFFQLQDFFRVESLEEGSGRVIAWAFAWQEIQHYFFLGGGFGHDESIMRPNYWWLSRLGHQGGVHNSYLSMWFDAGIIGLVVYLLTFISNVFRAMKNNYIVIAFAVSVLFNIMYESWLVGSLNPFTIVFLIILTIFTENLSGSDYVAEVEETKLTEELAKA